MLKQKPKKKKPVQGNQKVKKTVDFRKARNKIKGIVGSFRVRKCYVTIDTGNMPTNGILYPWLYLLGTWTGKNMTINFWGENTFILKIENSIGRMLWAFIKS